MKCLLLDVDGVLITSERFSKQYQETFGISNELMLPFFESEEFEATHNGKGDLKQILTPYLAKWKWQGSVEELLEWWFRAQSTPNVKLLSVVKELRAKGMKCYLATNQEQYRTDYLRKQLGDQFDGIFASCEMGCQKPSFEFFEKVLEETKVKPEEIVFFDDTQKHVDGAKKLEIKAYFYTSFEDFEEKLQLI